MNELIKINENDYYVECPSKIGIVKISDKDVVLIDSGNDDSAGKMVLRILEENNWHLKAIFNTHSHADHIGGNSFLQKRTNCLIYANGMECVYTNNPELEGFSLYGGFPIPDIRVKFLMAKKSEAGLLTDDVLPQGMSVLNLPGHCFDMVGFVTKDKTAYIGDAIMSPEQLKKHKISYQWDIKKSLETLDYLKTIDAAYYVPSHGSGAASIEEDIEINRNTIFEIKEKIIDICKEPRCFDYILKSLFEACCLQMSGMQYVLVGSTVRSYISNLYEEGNLSTLCRGGEFLWVRN